MTRRKDAVVRNFPPRFASRETMAYLLDISTDTFDRVVAAGDIEAPHKVGGMLRWPVEKVFARLEGYEVTTDEDAKDREEIRAGTQRAFGRPPRH